jgi:hypothetical protein
MKKENGKKIKLINSIINYYIVRQNSLILFLYFLCLLYNITLF